MKKIFTFFIFVLMSAVLVLSNIKVKADVAEIGEVEKLFYGYNVTGGKELQAIDSISLNSPIIDENSDYINHIRKSIGNTTEQSYNYRSSSYLEVAASYASNVSAGIFGKVYMVDVGIDTQFNKTTAQSNRYSELYELYSTTIERYYYVVQLDTEEIRDYLDSKFAEELNAVNSVSAADALFKKYGTHLITGYTMGGQLLITNYQSAVDSNIQLSSSQSLESKISATVKAITAGTSVSIEGKYSNEESQGGKTSTYKCTAYGGDSISSLTPEDLFTYNQSLVDGNNAGFMYTRWVNSINEGKNLSIIGIPSGAQSIPLWELLAPTSSSLSKRQYLMESYIKLCGDKYAEYNSRFKELTRNPTSSASGVTFSTLNSVYIRTSNNYFYEVEQEDLTSTGNHYEVHNGDYLYLDITNYEGFENISYDCQNCELIDKKNGIFKVTGTTGNCKIREIISTDEDEYTSVILNTPIEECNFEGGAGTEDYPYIILTKEQFMDISSNPSKCYILYSDIYFGNSTVTSLGNFYGTLDGNYCTISCLKISSAKEWGLFNVNNGTIKNLKLYKCGSAFSNEKFESGGTNCRTDYTNNNYSTTNFTIKSVRAGVLCSRNNGKIDNCYLDNIYIRNICKNDQEYIVDSSITMSTGIITGENVGTIKNCKVNESRVINSYVKNDEKLNTSIRVYTGGICGKLVSGEISSCVVNFGETGTLFSQAVNNTKIGSDCVVNAMAGGLCGYCNNSATIKNCYVKDRGDVQNQPKTIDVSYKNLNYDPKYYLALRSKTIVTGAEANLTITDTFANSISVTDYYTYDAIGVTGKNGNNLDSTNTFTKLQKINQLDITSKNDYNKIGLNSECYNYDNNVIVHQLEKTKTNLVIIQEDVEQSTFTSFYYNERFSPKGLAFEEIINGTTTKETYAFKIIFNSEDSSTIDDKLTIVGNGDYNLSISIYEDSKPYTIQKNIQVKETVLEKLFVKEPDENYSIYYDMIDDYIKDFGYNTIQLMGLLTNGEEIRITSNDQIYSNMKLELFSLDLERGHNIIQIRYSNGVKTFDTSYNLYVNERNISGITIVDQPSKVNYVEGNTVDLTGIKVSIEYDKGESKIISDKNELETIGSVLTVGQNSVGVVYKDYSHIAYITCNATEKEYTITFKDYNGTVLDSKTYHYGDTVTEPSSPTRSSDNTYDYTFKSWDKDVTVVSGNAEYTAIYTAIYKEYTIIFENYNGKLLDVKTYHYGDTVTEPSTPTRTSDNTYDYTFKSWDKIVTTVTGNAEYTATYNAIFKEYTITFKDYNGTVLDSKTYHYGDTVTEPSTPTRTSDNTYNYTFKSWDKAVTPAIRNVEYTAVYDQKEISLFIKKVQEAKETSDYNLKYKLIKEALSLYQDSNDENDKSYKKELDLMINEFNSYVDSANNDVNSSSTLIFKTIFTAFAVLFVSSILAFIIDKSRRY